MLHADSVEPALDALGGLLAERGASFDAVVLGGANLLVSGVITRPTVDVDVVAARQPDGSLSAAIPLPEIVADCVATIGRLRGLPPDWLNSMAGSEFEHVGMPLGSEQRLRPQQFGTLTVWWVDRIDMIAFKVVAAVDHLSYPTNKHLNDLRLLEPKREELDHAVAWFEQITAPTSAAFIDLDLLLQEFGHAR